MDLGAIIRERAEANGVDAGTLARIAQIESGTNPNAAASGSSARGLMQFTAPTWKQYGNGADPLDPTASADAGARLLRDNAAALKSAGLDPTPGSLYLSHFAGAGGARKLLTADPSASVSSVLGDAAVTANPFLAKMTVADLRSWAGGKMDGTPAPTSGTAAAAPAQPTGMLDSPAAPTAPVDNSTGKALAQLQAAVAGPQQQEAPLPPMQQMAMPPPRRIDPAMLQKMLSSPLQAGFS